LGYDAEGIKNLEEELMEAQLNLEVLENKSIEERDARLLIQSKLEDAIANAEEKATAGVDINGSSLSEYKMQLLEKDQNINELETQLADSVAALAEKEAELELATAMNEVSNLDYNESKMIEGLKAELAELRQELVNTNSVPSPELASNNDDMREKLEEAIAESFELQAQLDETQRRLSTLENSRNPNDEMISEYISIIDKAQLNEKKAIDEIDALTAALENSEQLRQELESLLDEFQSNGN
jgi:chromosome segregation ATPase